MLSSFVALSLFFSLALAHGHIKEIIVGGVSYEGYEYVLTNLSCHPLLTLPFSPQQGTTEDSIARPVRNTFNVSLICLQSFGLTRCLDIRNTLKASRRTLMVIWSAV